MNHRWLENLDEFEAILVCTTQNLRPWDADAVDRAFSTFQFESYSIAGEDDAFLRHVETGAIVRYDGGIVAIDLGDSLLKEAFPDLIYALHALGWNGADVHHPAATMREFLNDIGRSIPANIDFDIQAAVKDENRLENTPVVSHLQSATRDYINGLTPPPSDTDVDSDALSGMFANVLGINQSENTLNVDFEESNSELSESFDLPTDLNYTDTLHPQADDTQLVSPVISHAAFEDEFAEPALFDLDQATELDNEIELPEAFIQAQMNEDSATQDFNVISQPETNESYPTENIGSESQTAVSLPPINPNVVNNNLVEADLMPNRSNANFSMKKHVESENLVTSDKLSKDPMITDQFVTVGHSILVFNLASNPITRDEVVLLAEKHDILVNDIEYIRPGEDNGAVRWDVLSEIPEDSPTLAATFAQDMVSDFEYGQLVAAAIITAKLSNANASLRDLLMLLCEDNYQNIASRFPYVNMLQRNYSSHAELIVKSKFISVLSTLMFSAAGSNFIDPNFEDTRVTNVFTIRELAKSDKACMLVFNVDSLDTQFTHWVVELIRAFSSRHAQSKRFAPPPLKKVDQVAKLDLSQDDAVRIMTLLKQAGFDLPK